MTVLTEIEGDHPTSWKIHQGLKNCLNKLGTYVYTLILRCYLYTKINRKSREHCVFLKVGFPYIFIVRVFSLYGNINHDESSSHEIDQRRLCSIEKHLWIFSHHDRPLGRTTEGYSEKRKQSKTKWENWITKEENPNVQNATPLWLLLPICIFSYTFLYNVGFFWHVWRRNDTLFYPHQAWKQQ